MSGKTIIWTSRAKAQLRAIDQQTALHILHTLGRLIASGEGDVKRLRAAIRLNIACESAIIVCSFTISMTAYK